MGSSHRHLLCLLDDPVFFPFPPPSSSSCPFLPPSPFAFTHHHDLDIFLTTTIHDPFPAPHDFLLRDLTHRVAALEVELSLAARAPQPARRRKYTYAAHSPGGRKVKWTAEDSPRTGRRALKWEAELASTNHDGFDRKWKWEAKSKAGSAGKAKTKWGAEIKGKGCLDPWSHAYTWEEDFSGSEDDEEDYEVEEKPEKKIKAAAKEDKKKDKKCFQIPEDNTDGCDAIRKVFLM